MQTARDKIRELRALHEDGLLSQQEFDRRKNAILDAEYARPGGVPASAPPVKQGTELGLMAGQEVGPQNRRYRLERLIAMGGMGQVWAATDLATHAELGHSELVALKILPPQLTQSPAHARLLIEEATQARRLAHDNIVRVYEWAQDPATASYFIIMECLEGQDLDAWLAEHKTVEFLRVERMLRPIANALDYAWDKHRLVHRDIKPGNVFLTRRGEIKLLDFGIAARARGEDGKPGLLAAPTAGTAGYRAPEAGTQKGAPNPQLDVYAVAVMIYQMLSGAMPFEDPLTDKLPPAPPGLNDLQWQVLQKGFAIAPQDRPATVTQLLDALREAAGPTAEEKAAQEAEAARQAEERRMREEQEAAEQRRKAEAARQLEAQRQVELAAKRKAEAQAAALEMARVNQQRREAEKQRKLEAEAVARERKERLRQQLLAKRDEEVQKARQLQEEKQRKLEQQRAEAAYRAEQERHRKEQAARNAAELARMIPSGSAVADASGVLRDRFLDGSGVGPDLVLIPTGRFQMGSNEFERAVATRAGSHSKWLERETPAHWVGIERSFALGRYPVTVGEWIRFVKATGWEGNPDVDWASPGFRQDERHPVVCVSWHDAQEYVQWLSKMTGHDYRLPSEAEWEYACRAGTHTAFSFGDNISTDYANYDGNFTYNDGPKGSFRNGTSPVGSYPPNAWGLFDMHGNVWEWVQDVVHDNYEGAPLDGSAWEEGGDRMRRILRGGAWLYQPRYLRSALRNGYSAMLANDVVGFRVARAIE